MSDELKKIKDKYGENMMHLCRELFPTILEEENVLLNILKENFAYSKYLYDDIVNNKLIYGFRDFINSKFSIETKNIETDKTPFELFKEVGYTLYECKIEKDVQNFRGYYSPGEILCTFNGGRLLYNYVFFAIKDNAKNIRREDFPIPTRQDEYGTSVLSIQFSKGKTNTLSIKNRYNHRVFNPDATFYNNLEKIAPGLTNSFEKYYHLNINQGGSDYFEIPGYIRANDGKFYKYNYEINNVFYGPNNVIIDNGNFIEKYYNEKEKYLIVDYFVVDLVNKKISMYNDIFHDSFTDEVNNINKIKIINLQNKNKEIIIETNDNNVITLIVDKYNRIISYTDNKTKQIGDSFLFNNAALEIIKLPNVKEIGNNFLISNTSITKLFLPNLQVVGDGFLHYNKYIDYMYLPRLKKVGRWFMFHNRTLKDPYMPNLNDISFGFFACNKYIQEQYLKKSQKKKLIK